MTKEELRSKYLPVGGYFFFIAFGLVVFFIAAFLVVFVRTKSANMVVMPDVVGKPYNEVHNELMRLQLKVRLESKRYPDKTDGIIIYQSIRPGREIEAGSKVSLTVNIGLDRIIMPDLKGQTLASAKNFMEKVLSGENYVSLTLGGITYVEAKEGELPDTVVDQIPEAGKNTTAAEKVFLLVTKSSTKKKEGEASLGLDFRPGDSFAFAQRALARSKVPFKTEVVATKFRPENGRIESIQKIGNEYKFKVFFFEPEDHVESGYESFEYKIRENGTYSMIVQDQNDENKKTEISSPTSYQEGEKIQTVFYRTGDVTLVLLDANGSKVKSKDYENEF
ncbi:PASTA domain-containing protein [Leptospira langatensis]|uniref:PASTA domain-containing protein n=1 Tax=Leptospira langatensis TaxID=2484983 RepID=A0A5F1ZYG8_9LEPT|nr:PASTA domain-containing protein [Leptospira langatensis]TGK04249.1 PASTA domain-containing protein [Leptospira langatensis]TGL43728.1 PASTA domain-containing protein [Leptospira langatensis]